LKSGSGTLLGDVMIQFMTRHEPSQRVMTCHEKSRLVMIRRDVSRRVMIGHGHDLGYDASVYEAS